CGCVLGARLSSLDGRDGAGSYQGIRDWLEDDLESNPRARLSNDCYGRSRYSFAADLGSRDGEKPNTLNIGILCGGAHVRDCHLPTRSPNSGRSTRSYDLGISTKQGAND